MKIFFNRKPVSGPWGGGNKTLSSIVDNLKSNGHTVVYHLEDKIDVLFCMDPRPKNYSFKDILNYKEKTNAKLIQRVGDVGSHSKPELTQMLINNLSFVDHVIFTSYWAKEYLGQINLKKYSVVKNRPLPIFLQNRNKKSTLSNKKLKIVTHHWSDNPKKGFDVYQALGELIENKVIDSFDLTYIGRYSKSFSNKGINIIPPIAKEDLSKVLPLYDIYLTASLEEAGANHVLEAIACGLPVLYREGGGSINEYCDGFGVEYKNNVFSILDSIIKMTNNYKDIKTRILKNNESMSETIDNYVKIISEVSQ